jgi:solute carrier family 25 citrate transporter 1
MATIAGSSVSTTTSALKPDTKLVETPKKKTVAPGVSLLAGAVGGAVEATATYPFEFAKTRAQLNKTIAGANVPVSKNPLAVISQTARQDGFMAIYTGCSTLILGTAFKAGVRFLSFDAIKNVLADSDGKLSPARGILAGMVAGSVESVVAVTPTERIKTAL